MPLTITIARRPDPSAARSVDWTVRLALTELSDDRLPFAIEADWSEAASAMRVVRAAEPLLPATRFAESAIKAVSVPLTVVPETSTALTGMAVLALAVMIDAPAKDVAKRTWADKAADSVETAAAVALIAVDVSRAAPHAVVAERLAVRRMPVPRVAAVLALDARDAARLVLVLSAATTPLDAAHAAASGICVSNEA